MGLDIGKMQTFVEVANYLSFTKAAKQLHTTQSVVSKQIMSIENMLQMQLFLRIGSNVRLTPAGRSLYEDWKKILVNISESINTANSRQHGHTRLLRVGYSNSKLPWYISRNYTKSEADQVYFSRHTYPELLSKLTSGDLDLVYYGLFDLTDIDHDPFRYRIVGQSRFVACALENSPLARYREIGIEDLRGYSFIMLSPLTSPSWFSTMTNLCREKGFSPRIFMYVDDVSSLFMNLQRPDQVVLTDFNVLEESPNSNIVAVPIRDAVSGSVFIWHKDNENDAILEFIECAEDFFKEKEKTDLR